MRRRLPCDDLRLLRQMGPARAGALRLRRLARRVLGPQRGEGGALLRLRCARVPVRAGEPTCEGAVPLHRPLGFQPFRGGARLQGRQGLPERSRARRGQGERGRVRPSVHRRVPAVQPHRSVRAGGQPRLHQGVRPLAPARRQGGARVRRHHRGNRLASERRQPGSLPDIRGPAAFGAKPRVGGAVPRGARRHLPYPGGHLGAQRRLPAARRGEDGGFLERRLLLEGAPPPDGLLLAARGGRHRLARRDERGHRPTRDRPAGAPF